MLFASSPVDIDGYYSKVGVLRELYAVGQPWPHLVIDGLLNVDIARRASRRFPPLGTTRVGLARFLGARSYRGSVEKIDESIEQILAALEHPDFVRLVESITGIPGLIADVDRLGAGLHQGARGSHLRVHADHNTHPNDAGWFRRVNVLVYLNDEWCSEWNGDLELWDRKAERCEKRIQPVFNRCVIFGVDDTSFHGYGPLRLPRKRTRNALAVYYYSQEPAPMQAYDPHSTQLPVLPGESRLKRMQYRILGSALSRIKKALKIPH